MMQWQIETFLACLGVILDTHTYPMCIDTAEMNTLLGDALGDTLRTPPPASPPLMQNTKKPYGIPLYAPTSGAYSWVSNMSEHARHVASNRGGPLFLSVDVSRRFKWLSAFSSFQTVFVNTAEVQLPRVAGI